MDGISPRYIQDKISNSLVIDKEWLFNPFIVLARVKQKLILLKMKMLKNTIKN